MPKIDVEIGIRSRIKQGLASAQKSISGFFNRAKSLASSTVGTLKNLAVGFAALGTAAVAAGTKIVKTYLEQSRTLAKLNAVQKAAGFTSGFTTKELEKQATIHVSDPVRVGYTKRASKG